MISLFLGLLVVSAIPSSDENFVKHRLLESWTVEMKVPANAGDQVKALFLGGLSPEDQSFYTSDVDHLVSKRSLLSGERLWKSSLPSEAQSTWAIQGDSLFGGDTKGRLFRISTKDGQVIWSIKTKGFFLSAPLVNDKTVLAMNSLGTLEAYSREKGEWKWQQGDPAEVPMGLWGAKSGAWFGSSVAAGFPSGILQIFNPENGMKIWSSSFSNPNTSEVGLNDIKSIQSVGSYLVTASYNGDLRAWKALSGSQKLLWEKKVSAAAPVSFSEDESMIFVSDRQGKLQAYEVETGYLRWEKSLGSMGSQVAVEGDRLWIGTADGRVVVVRTDGAELARTKSFESGIYAMPLIVNESEAVVVSDRGILRRLALVRSGI